MVNIRKLTDKNIMVFVLIFLVAFFLILMIWYVNKNNSEERKTIIKNYKEIEIENEINIGLYLGKKEDNIEKINLFFYDNSELRYVLNLVYNGLFKYNEENNLEPILIQEFAKIDEKNYVFKLKENIKFHNGKILTSDDVKNTIEKIYSNEQSVYQKCVENIQNVKVIDSTTFRINLINIEENFEKNLIFPIATEEINIGTNLYEILSISNEKIVLENLQNKQILNFYIYDDEKDFYYDFKSKKTDLINSIDDKNYIKYLGEFGYGKKEYKGNKNIFLSFNEEVFLKNSMLRESILSAINIDEIIEKVFKGDAYNIGRFKLDLDRTVELLEQQRYIYDGKNWKRKNKKLDLEMSLDKNDLTNLEIAYIIKGQLEKVGIKIELKILDSEEYYKIIENNEYDILISSSKNTDIDEKIICNKLKLLHSLSLSGKINPTFNNIFYNVETWRKIIK